MFSQEICEELVHSLCEVNFGTVHEKEVAPDQVAPAHIPHDVTREVEGGVRLRSDVEHNGNVVVGQGGHKRHVTGEAEGDRRDRVCPYVPRGEDALRKKV